jgi:hypothetical protein
MTSPRRLEANRHNALRSTGPKTVNGKERSRANAVRHGLTAETVVESLEHSNDYKAFEAAIISDYGAETAVARELVLRLASLLWRLRRATAIETDLFRIQAEAVLEHQLAEAHSPDNSSDGASDEVMLIRTSDEETSLALSENEIEQRESANVGNINTMRSLTFCFLRVANLDSGAFERLNRYQTALWRQTIQAVFALHPIRRR